MAKVKFKSRHENEMGQEVWLDIEGTKVEVPGYEEYTFVFHKRENLKGWFVSEYSTGLGVYPVTEYCKNKEQAVSVARQYLDMYTSAGVKVADGFTMYLDRYNRGEPINKPVTKAKQRRLDL